MQNAQETRLDLFKIQTPSDGQGACAKLEIIKSFHQMPSLLACHDTRIIVDRDVYEVNTFTGDYTKVWTFQEKYLFVSAVGLTRTKILFGLPHYAKICLFKWNPLDKMYVEISRGKLSQHDGLFLTNLKLNLFSQKTAKEVFACFSFENVYKFTLDEKDLMQTKRKVVYRMKHQRCVDYKIVDVDHIIILYTY